MASTIGPQIIHMTVVVHPVIRYHRKYYILLETVFAAVCAEIAECMNAFYVTALT